MFKVARALERRAMQQELARLNATARRTAPAFDMLIGAEASWLRAVEQARQLSQTDDDLVIRGEPGSGRSTLARALHSASGAAT